MGKMQNVTLAWRVSCGQSVGWRKGLWEGVMEVHAFGQGVVGRARRDVISLLSEEFTVVQYDRVLKYRVRHPPLY